MHEYPVLAYAWAQNHSQSPFILILTSHADTEICVCHACAPGICLCHYAQRKAKTMLFKPLHFRPRVSIPKPERRASSGVVSGDALESLPRGRFPCGARQQQKYKSASAQARDFVCWICFVLCAVAEGKGIIIMICQCRRSVI